ncbi:MAG: methyl-coenzyme M reductase I operon protein C [Methanosarcinaceae archaeon]|nr:methyl-coenzyme M reductase I operon protein C [Methanosarcinaceae archaeon]
MLNFDRNTQVVDCRLGTGHGTGGSLARAGTLSQAGQLDVVVVTMGSGRRHITKPVCEITFAIRRENVQTGVLVLYAGTGYPDSGTMGTFGIDPKEVDQINMHKLAIIHFGNVRNHFVRKAEEMFRGIDIPVIIISQALVDYEDFANVGIKTRYVKPKEEETISNGMIVDIVTGVARGEACSREKLSEIIIKTKRELGRIKE